MTYGPQWMKLPPPQGGDPNTRIATADLEGIRHFMCPISGGDINRCKTCPGIKGCSVGQRIMALLDQQERQKWTKVEVEQSPGKVKAKNKISAESVADPVKAADDRQMFQDACESGNATSYLIQRHYSEGAAKEKLIFWCKRYPQIAIKFGGKKHIIKKPRATDYQIVTAEMLNNLNGPPPLKYAGLHDIKQETEESPAQPPEALEPQKKISPAEQMRSKTEANILQAIASGDPIFWLMNTRNNSAATAKQTLKRWKKNHPELFEASPQEQRPKQESPEETEPTKEPEQRQAPKQQESDEISLEDFLAEFEVQDVDAEQPEPEPPEPQETFFEEQPACTENPNRELAKLMETEAALLLQIAELQDQVWGIRQRRRDIEQKMSH